MAMRARGEGGETRIQKLHMKNERRVSADWTMTGWNEKTAFISMIPIYRLTCFWMRSISSNLSRELLRSGVTKRERDIYMYNKAMGDKYQSVNFAQNIQRAIYRFICVEWMPSGWNGSGLNEPGLKYELLLSATSLSFPCCVSALDVLRYACTPTRSGCHTSCCQLVDKCVK